MSLARKTRPALALLVAVLVAVSLAGCTAPSAGERPAPRAERHGALLSSERIPAPPGARAWRIRYTSEVADGTLVPVTGLVIAPRSAMSPGGYPILTWGHGLVGAADRCAPSARPRLVGDALPEVALALGTVIVASDYAGLGTAGLPETGVAESEGRNLLDAALAVRQLPWVQTSSRLVIGGESMGGGAALFAAQQAPAYASELDVAAVVVAAPAAMPRELLASFGRAGLLGDAVEGILGYASAYGLDPADVLTPSALRRLPLVRTSCADRVLAAFSRDRPAEVLARDPASLPAWRRAMASNTPGAARIDAPVLVVQGSADAVVPVASTDALVARLRRAGDDVTYRTLPGVGHEPLAAIPSDIARWVLRTVT